MLLLSNPATDKLLSSFQTELDQAVTTAQIEALRRKYAGKASPVKMAQKGLAQLPPDERRKVASNIAAILDRITSELDQAAKSMGRRELEGRLKAEWQDLTLPGLAQPRGGRHPVSEVEERCMAVLRRLGFHLIEGPDVESAFYTFTALNIPEHHPARDMQDTFWISDTHVLRTHTTSVQARVLKEKPPLPIRIASAGRVYRNEDVDATHLAMFHQFEGLWVDYGLTFAHLKGILTFIARELFGERPIRFKPKYYPYTEPSAGVDIQCSHCGGMGCPSCHNAGWITILGSGMVHPKVLLDFGYDPAVVSGIAFGLGTTRMAAQRVGVTAIRELYRQDIRMMRALYRGR